MSPSSAYENLIADLRQLKLSTIRHHLDAHLSLAQSKSLTYLEFLKGLTAEELKGREESNYQRRLKSARFPVLKNLEEFDFAFQPSVPREKILQLKDCPLGRPCRQYPLGGSIRDREKSSGHCFGTGGDPLRIQSLLYDGR